MTTRAERAQEVRATYRKEGAGPGAWVVSHPLDEGRTYVVSTAPSLRCTCPDFMTREDRDSEPCKHILALVEQARVKPKFEPPIVYALPPEPWGKDGDPFAD